jgi:decaprenylphospho-beta-D-ribofuranose 2-oxidase
LTDQLSGVEEDLYGWARFPRSVARTVRPERIAEPRLMLDSSSRSLIARGSGLAYGDAALNQDEDVLLTQHLNHILQFDTEHGTIVCQSGVQLEDVLSVAVPKGWSLSVTPGTARATVGGCLACDVHGKNHHLLNVGSFANHVSKVQILTGTGEVVSCDAEHNPELFWATAGGMGLTGIILQLSLKLTRISSTRFECKDVRTHSLSETMKVLNDTRDNAYSVAWLDGNSSSSQLGAGIVMLGEHVISQDADQLSWQGIKRRHLLAGPPQLALNVWSSRFFNLAISTSSRFKGQSSRTVDFVDFYYPLDRVDNWSLLYGGAGFIEYQVVLPEQSTEQFVAELLEGLQDRRYPSFLTSMKRMGQGNEGLLSFPFEGFAFSVDVPVYGPEVLEFFSIMDQKLVEAGGRLYLAKDGRTASELIGEMYPELAAFKLITDKYDPQHRFNSDMSRRLGLRT